MIALLDRPFLTELDSRAAVKGSRDPLGIQPIWTRLGRYVVGNLTTVSNSVLDFKVMLLGRWFAEQLSDELGSESELATFLKWEQLAAYVRGAWNADWSFRGTERVKRTLSEGSRVTLSDGVVYQILGNQRTYGLWGLYTMPARASGLLEGEMTRLTAESRDLVERQYVPVLERKAGKGASRILEMLRKPSCPIDVKAGHMAALEPVSEVLGWKFNRQERNYYRESLAYGGPNDKTSGCQRLLADLFTGLGDVAWTRALVAELDKKAGRLGANGEELAIRLRRIGTAESVLAPTGYVFGHLLGLDGKTLEFAAGLIDDAWGKGVRTVDPEAFRSICPEIESTAFGAGDRWTGIGEALAAGAYQRLIELLVEQNRSVMEARGGAPWIDIRDGKLHVRFRDERVQLPDRSSLPTLWTSPYFLYSLRTVANALKEG